MAQRSAINYGLSGVVIGESSICEIDGKNGRLFYRGVPIQELVELPFEDVAYLLIHGHLPSEAESLGFKKHMAAKRFLPDTVQEILRDCINLEPLSALQTALSTMDLADPDCSEDLVCSFPSIITHYHAYRQGKEPLEPDPSLNHATDFLRRLSGSMPCAEMAHAINTDFILHAEHGACASSLAVRTATSAGSSLQAALLAGLSCLSGSRHGGAVNDIGKLLDRLKSPAAAIEFVSNENDLHKRPIPGFGHRIYKVEDPRSEIYRALSDRIRKPLHISMRREINNQCQFHASASLTMTCPESTAISRPKARLPTF